MSAPAHPVETVLGPRRLDGAGVVDAHTHLWIDRVPGGAPDGPVLDDEPALRSELQAFAAAGGRAVVDCQPPQVGRDAARLRALAAATGVDVVACTGFHLRRYYPDGPSTWTLGTDAAADRFLRELSHGVDEVPSEQPVRAGAVKVAHPGHPDAATSALLAAAASAARAAGVMLVVHTERGAGVEELAGELLGLGMSSQDVMLCHVDKRPDLALHLELAAAGFLLEYDTFVRPRYRPQEHAWPLLLAMLEAGHGDAVSCASDLADRSLWRFGGMEGGGPAGYVQTMRDGLAARGVDAAAADALLGANVVERLRRSGGTS